MLSGLNHLHQELLETKPLLNVKIPKYSSVHLFNSRCVLKCVCHAHCVFIFIIFIVFVMSIMSIIALQASLSYLLHFIFVDDPFSVFGISIKFIPHFCKHHHYLLHSFLFLRKSSICEIVANLRRTYFLWGVDCWKYEGTFLILVHNVFKNWIKFNFWDCCKS